MDGRPCVQRGTLPSVQAWRGIAALLVVFAHAHSGAFTGAAKGGDLPSLGSHMDLLMLSAFGVDLFFVISGFIITYVSWGDFGDSSRVGTFARKRFIRIFPVYWVYLTFLVLFYLVVKVYFPDSIPLASLSVGDIVGSYFFVSTTATEVAGRWAGVFPAFYNFYIPISWTLLFEVYFYTLVGLCLVLRRAFLIPVLLVAFGVGTVVFRAEFAANRFFWFLSDPILFEFLWGVLACVLIKGRVFKSTGLAVGMIVLSIGAVVATSFPAVPFFRCLSWGLPAFGLVFGCLVLEQNGALRVPVKLRDLGDASYSIYLIHFPLIRLCELTLTQTGLWNVLGGDVFVWVLFLMSIVLGQKAYVYLEKPLLAKLSRFKGTPFTLRTSAAPGN